MKEKIARFFEDTFYTALIHLRSFLERLHIFHPPTEQDLQKDIEAMCQEFDETTRYQMQQYELALEVARQEE